jgi:hypothetical protein
MRGAGRDGLWYDTFRKPRAAVRQQFAQAVGRADWTRTLKLCSIKSLLSLEGLEGVESVESVGMTRHHGVRGMDDAASLVTVCRSLRTLDWVLSLR